MEQQPKCVPAGHDKSCLEARQDAQEANARETRCAAAFGTPILAAGKAADYMVYSLCGECHNAAQLERLTCEGFVRKHAEDLAFSIKEFAAHCYEAATTLGAPSIAIGQIRKSYERLLQRLHLAAPWMSRTCKPARRALRRALRRFLLIDKEAVLRLLKGDRYAATMRAKVLYMVEHVVLAVQELLHLMPRWQEVPAPEHIAMRRPRRRMLIVSTITFAPQPTTLPFH